MNENVYKYFKEISRIPHETYNIVGISNYLVDFAKSRGLEVYQDNEYNVIIKKEASDGYINHDPIILQAHMDMVCQKDADFDFDFSKDSIEVIEENGFLRANHTTLGADDGIGIAMILSVLDGDYKHPKIEAIFTVNEEVGMEGALNLDINSLESNRLINLDSEEEGIFTCGCAGGIRLDINYSFKRKKVKGYITSIKLSNLLGGHSGTDISKGRINAIKFIASYLNDDFYRLISIDGGKVDNAICDNCSFVIVHEDEISFEELKAEMLNKLKELGEVNATISIDTVKGEENAISLEDTNKIVSYLNNCLNGVISYEEKLDNLVRTSLNLGVISTNDDNINIRHSLRSSKSAELDSLISKVSDLAKNIGCTVREINPYPEWEYKSDSVLRKLLEEVYVEIYSDKPIIQVIHAGLECGIFVGNKKNLDCVSIGPNIYDAHTPKESVEIMSVNRVYDYLIKVLERL